jgi:hypothetical protein
MKNAKALDVALKDSSAITEPSPDTTGSSSPIMKSRPAAA